ncbi:MAG: MarR family transcriptional regulator [Sphingomonas fennica]
MTTDSPTRAGPRSAQRRGPQAARAPRGRDVLSEQVARFVAPDDVDGAVAASDRHLMNYHRHFSTTDGDDAHFRATRAIVVAARRWRKLANERVKAIGQTMARWETLFLVAFTGNDLTQSELARLISVEGPTMVRMLDVLARDGLIERHQSSTDRRVTVNRITEKGTAVIGEMMEITNALRAEVIRDIDPDELAVCVSVLNKILKRLDELS